jgi:hypothetical protein
MIDSFGILVQGLYRWGIYVPTIFVWLGFRFVTFFIFRGFFLKDWNIFNRPETKFGFFLLFDIPFFDGYIASELFYERSTFAFWFVNWLNVLLALYVFLPIIFGLIGVVLASFG